MISMHFQVVPSYVVITPAYNEERYIRYPLESMVRQTLKPVKWIIVDDGSNDGTAGIIKAMAGKHGWMLYHYNKKRPGETYYSSNVYAILEGMMLLRDIPYSYLGILDADIELCDDYYERIIGKFERHNDLGIAAGTYLEREGDRWVEARIDRRSTPKAIQVFRRECYESTKGYIPFKYGGEDSGMEIMARMNGWKTWSFPSIVVRHCRPVGTGEGRSVLHARFRLGMTDYCLGTHPCFMLCKALKRMFWEKPYLLSGTARFLGYLAGYSRGLERQLPAPAIDYLRKEQLRRIFQPSRENWMME